MQRKNIQLLLKKYKTIFIQIIFVYILWKNLFTRKDTYIFV